MAKEKEMQEYMYTFEVLMGYNGIKGLTDKPFTTIEPISAKTESEAIEKLDAENDALGYKVLNIISMKLETSQEYKKRTDREFDETFGE